MQGVLDHLSPHPWNLSPKEAIALQEELRGRIVRQDEFGTIRTVAGVDVFFDEAETTARAAVAVLSFPDLKPVEDGIAERPVTFPYIPGLFSFREIPPILAALSRLRTFPDLLFCDGQGLAHPRRFGLACHLGVVTGLPSIGVAKTLFVGDHEELPSERGAWRPLVDQGEVVGAAVRTSAGVRPVYVSIGHRVSLETAIDLTLRATLRFRQSEPARRAHHLAIGAQVL